MRKLKICSNVGCPRQNEHFEFSDQLSFCTTCGTKLEQGLGAFCHHCSVAIKATWDWCGFCGGPVSTSAMAEQKDRDKEERKRARRKQPQA